MKSNYILKIYSHPKSTIRGFLVFRNLDWNLECESEKSLDYSKGASFMSQHETRAEAYDHARKILGNKQFESLF